METERSFFFLRTPPCFFVHRQGRWIVPLLPPLPFSADQGRRGEKGGSSGTGGFRSCSMQPFELVGPREGAMLENRFASS